MFCSEKATNHYFSYKKVMLRYFFTKKLCYLFIKKLHIIIFWQKSYKQLRYAAGNNSWETEQNFFNIFLTCSGRREEGYPYKAFIKQNLKGYKAFSYTTLKRVPVSDIGYKMFLKRYRYNPTVQRISCPPLLTGIL